MERILIADDDLEFTELLITYLQQQGFSAAVASNGAEALQALSSAAESEAPFDAMVLDIMMPVLNGLDALKSLRNLSDASIADTPVIMLTARGDDIDRIVGLELGADDYLPKPANPRELVARLRAIVRRRQPLPVANADSEQVTAGDLVVHMGRRDAMLAGEPLELTTSEWDLLAELVRDAGKVVSKHALSVAVTGRPLGPYDRSLDMHVSNLRRKLGENGAQRIKTVRNRGYQYAV